MSQIGSWGAWLTVICAGLVTLAIRVSFIILPADAKVPEWVTDGLKFVAAAVLPALLVPDVLFRDAAPGDTFNYYRIIAAVIAAAFALRTRNTLGTMAVGMAALWLLKWWGPI